MRSLEQCHVILRSECIDETLMEHAKKQKFLILIIPHHLTCRFRVTSDQVKYPWLPWSQAAKASRNTWQFRCHNEVAANFGATKAQQVSPKKKSALAWLVASSDRIS